MRVSIVGTGYVGLTTGVCLAAIGHEVTCLDSNRAKVETLRQGRCPIYEPHLEELMASAAARLKFATSYADSVPDSDVVFIAVGTPPGPDGAPDLQYLRAAAQSIGEHLGDGFTVVVNKSTVPIGSGNWVDSLVRDAFKAKHSIAPNGRFAVASNPEFLREGSALKDSLYPDRIVVGTDNRRALELLYNLYQPILEQSFRPPLFLPRPDGMETVPLVTADLASAELIKYAANAFLALKISFINEIGQLAGRVGADVSMIAKGIGLDRRIGSAFLQAGAGWGGSCFGKDTSALIATAADYGLSMPIVTAAREVNQRQRRLVIERLLGELKILKGRTIGMLGLAFKPHTDDLRDAPAIDIARCLSSRGAQVKVFDPAAMDRARVEFPEMNWQLMANAAEAAAETDALVLITEWPEFQRLDWRALAGSMQTPILLDARSALDRPTLEAAGFRYLRI